MALVVLPFLLSVTNSYYLYLANLILIYSISTIGLNIVVGFTGQLSLGHAAFFAVGAYTSAYLSINGL